MQAALATCSATSEIINWLEVEWPKVQELFVDNYTAKFNDIISEKEARDVLVKHPLKPEEALKECKAVREEKVRGFHVIREVIE